LAITPDQLVSGRLLPHWGVYPFKVKGASSLDEILATGARLAKDIGLAKACDLVVIIGGVPVSVAGAANLLKVENVN